jgi:hypothetical protein
MYGITKFAMANLGLLKIAMASKELPPRKPANWRRLSPVSMAVGRVDSNET